MIKHKELAKSLWFFFLFFLVCHEVLALLNCSSSWELNLAGKTVTGQGGSFKITWLSRRENSASLVENSLKGYFHLILFFRSW